MIVQDWETETLDIDMGRMSNDDDLGVDLAGGRWLSTLLLISIEDTFTQLIHVHIAVQQFGRTSCSCYVKMERSILFQIFLLNNNNVFVR